MRRPGVHAVSAQLRAADHARLADCYRRIELEFELDSEAERANSLHKIDTLLAALRVFRKGLVDEFEQYDRRELDASRE